MPDREAYRYIDSRGDTIIFKFNPSFINDPTRSPLEIWHEWKQDNKKTIQLSAMLLDADTMIERYAKDAKPAVGFVLHTEKETNGRTAKYKWVGFRRSSRGFVIDKTYR